MICRGCKYNYPDEDGLISISKEAGVVDCETKEPIELACFICIEGASNNAQPADSAAQTAA